VTKGFRNGLLLAFIVALVLTSAGLSLLVMASIAPAAAATSGDELFQGYNKQRGKWVTGNLGKDYYEGEFVSYQLRITSDSKVWGVDEFDIKFNFYQPPSDAIYIDGFDTSEDYGFQWSVGPMLLDGEPFPYSGWGTHIPTPEAGGSDISWPQITNFMDAYTPDTDSSPSQFRYFTVEGIPWNEVEGDYIVLFFRAHLALDIIWWEGEEEVLPTELDGDEFDEWEYPRHGSSFATGSSRHFFLEYPGIGSKTVPIPITEYPISFIEGHKYLNEEPYDGWEITLEGELELWPGLPPLSYQPPSVYTGTSPWTTGYYKFTGIVAGSYTLTEESPEGFIHEKIVVSGGKNVVTDEDTVSFDLDRGQAAIVDFYNRIQSSTATVLSNDTITLGESVTDTAYVTGLVGFPIPTGTVDFQVLIGTTWTPYDTNVPLSNGSATSISYTPTSAGTWYFRAIYSGDSNYETSQSGNEEEPLVVDKAPTEITTLLDPLGPITLGDTVVDHITITTTATGTLPNATGTWTVEASKDNTFTMGIELFVDSGTVSGPLLPFNASTGSWIPPSAGTWYFRATYSGDSNYESSVSDPIDEQLKVMPVGPPRTQGFWATHTSFTETIFNWNWNEVSPLVIGAGSNTKEIATPEELFGAFWSSISYKSDNKRRKPEDQARMILAQQLLAAILNYDGFGAEVPVDPVTGLDLIEAGNDAYAGDKKKEMIRVERLLDDYNQSGKSVPLPEEWEAYLEPATPDESKEMADIPYWDDLWDP